MPLTSTPAVRSSFAGSLSQLVVRGLIAGFVAGLLAGGIGYITGEQHIDAAIAIEESQETTASDHVGPSQAGSHHHEDAEPLVSRDGQRAGLFLATALSGAALGAIFACVLAAARTRSRLSVAGLIAAVGAAGWFAIAVVPFVKYPANPPAVGDPDTITQRTLLWFAMVVLGLLSVAVFAYTHRIVRARTASAVAPTAAAAFVTAVVVTVGYTLAPSINEVPTDFPATLLWQFRMSSAATQLTLWAALVGLFALLSERPSQSTAL
ncbi:CbtA family protein [Rhodococcoides fascians]|uniref:CbtA family protein n=1 Tax=Rhodococcoides fascians TaxID=1828 RepID=UPI00056543D2|nr:MULTISPECIES: CbtA family protein [Rhodococcus]OZF01312.1 hypothetical protein CH301_11265 [Rhodococcus sp. 15-1189-1-1a]OZF15483.1 hypothetical protein CH299_11815 [Rhodococcus sp. 14-2686-1-2]